MTQPAFPRLDNIGIVVDDLKRAIAFYLELGLELEGETTVEGDWVDRVVGLKGVRTEIAMMRTPDGRCRLELMKYLAPQHGPAPLNVPVNAMGIRRMMFAVKRIDDVVARLQRHGATFVGEMIRYGDTYKLCYLRGPDGVIVALAEEIGGAQETAEAKKSALPRMDNLLIVVKDMEAARAFFTELGLEPEGEPNVEGPEVDALLGLKGVKATLGILRTPDGHARIELDNFHSPAPVTVEPANAPVNTPGIRRVMFAVDNIEDVVARLRARGATLVGEIAEYENTYKLCYVRGPEGIVVGLAQQVRDGQGEG